MNEPFFAGHFPEKPVMPGVLILEALAQAAALLAMMSLGPDEREKLTYLMGIDGARSASPVVPDDRPSSTSRWTRHKGAVWKEKGTAIVTGRRRRGRVHGDAGRPPKEAK